MTAPAWLSAALSSAARYHRSIDLDPLAHFVGTPPQMAFWTCPSRRRLLRTGNQVGGKTTAACIEGLWWATHTHPHRRTPAGPVQIWFICVSWSQSLAIQRKMWALTPKPAITDETRARYTAERGFGANTPVMTFLDGSQIWFRTGKQDPLDQAGATLHLVLYDEPPKRQRNFSELERRLTRTGGEMALTMTPVNARVDWIKEMADTGALTDLHFRCTPEMLTLPNGTVLRTEAGDAMDAEWIAGERRKVLAFEEPVLIDGEWEMRADGQVFEPWDPTRHVVPRLYEHPDVGPKGRKVRLVLGIDWGDESLRTAAVLCAVQTADERRGIPGRVWILDEYVAQAATTVAMDADAVLAMLAARGLSWRMLASAHGDKRYTDARGRITRKSNFLFDAAIARRLGLASDRPVPRVRNAKRGERRGAGALWLSIRWMCERMMTPGGWAVDAGCSHLADALSVWDGTSMHRSKDVIDALRYALVEYWAPSSAGGRVVADRFRIE